MTSVLTPLTPLGSMHHSDTNTKAKNFVLVQRYQDMLKSLNDESDCSDLLMGPTPDQEVPVSYFCNDKIKTEVVEEEEAEIVPDTPTILGDLSNFGYIPSDTILHPGNDGNNGYNKPVNPFLNSYNNINNNSNNNSNNPNSIPAYNNNNNTNNPNSIPAYNNNNNTNNPNSIPAYNNNNNNSNNGHNNIPTPVYKACHDDNMPTTAINKQTIDFSSSRKPQDCFTFKQTTVTPNNSKSLQNYSQQSTSPSPKQQQQQQQQQSHHHQLQSIQNSCISSSTLLLSSSLPSSTQSQFWSSMPSSSSLSSTTSLSSSLSPPASSPSFQRQIAPQNNIFSTSPIPSSSSPMLINNSGSPAPSPYSSSSSLSLSSSSSPLLSSTSFTSTPPRSEQPTKVRSFVSELNGSGCTVLSGALPNFLNGSCFSTGNARAETDLLSSTRNQDDSIEYTDLDKVSEVSFYDDLTSVANKDDENRFPIEEMVEMMRSEIDRDRRELNLPHDPEYWSPQEVTRWVKWVCRKHNVPDISLQLESFSGAILCSRTSQSLMSLSPTSGLNVYQELELWKQELELWKTAQFSFGSSPQGFGSPSTSPVPSHMSSNHSNMDSQQFFHSSMDSSEDDVFFSENEVSSMKPQIAKASSSDSFKNINLQKFKNGPFKPRLGRGHKKAITLWQFLLELLVGEEDHSDCIKWLNKESRIFKIEDSKKVASLWGKVKSRPAMNYDKLSRSVRQYYRKGIIKKPEQTKRLVYQFCPGIC